MPEAAPTTGIVPQATWRVTLDGQDLTETLNPRLLSLSLTEHRAGEADELEIVLNDADGKLQIPRKGVRLSLAIGWARGRDVPIGLIDKGSFIVDEISVSGPPDIISIKARSADFTGSFRTRRERSYTDATVAQILGDIAADNGLSLRCDATLGAKPVPALGTGARSDAALLKALGRRFDAVATVKAGALIFAPIGKGRTAGGKAIPSLTIDRSQTDMRFAYDQAQRDDYNGVEARWHSKGSASVQSVNVGGGGSGPAKRLRRIYASETSARHAAEAVNSRMQRSGAKLRITLPLGRPDAYPDRSVTVTGYKAEINAQAWLIAEPRHQMDGSGGLVTSLQLETAKTSRYEF